jgi:hypothetical protein
MGRGLCFLVSQEFLLPSLCSFILDEGIWVQGKKPSAEVPQSVRQDQGRI